MSPAPQEVAVSFNPDPLSQPFTLSHPDSVFAGHRRTVATHEIAFGSIGDHEDPCVVLFQAEDHSPVGYAKLRDLSPDCAPAADPHIRLRVADQAVIQPSALRSLVRATLQAFESEGLLPTGISRVPSKLSVEADSAKVQDLHEALSKLVTQGLISLEDALVSIPIEHKMGRRDVEFRSRPLPQAA